MIKAKQLKNNKNGTIVPGEKRDMETRLKIVIKKKQQTESFLSA